MKKQINLYQPSCYPRREKATFKQFLTLLGICLFSTLVLCLILNKQFVTLQETTQQHQTLQIKKQNELSLFVNKLQNHHTPESKLQRQLALQDEIKAKQHLLASLAGIELHVTVSFSELMRGLSLANTSAVSIHDFSIIDGRLNITGQAKQSDSVPLWLTKLRTIKELSGITFEKLTISDSGDSNGFFFQLSNNLKQETFKGKHND